GVWGGAVSGGGAALHPRLRACSPSGWGRAALFGLGDAGDVQPSGLRGFGAAPCPGVALRFTPGYGRAALRATGVWGGAVSGGGAALHPRLRACSPSGWGRAAPWAGETPAVWA